MMNVLECIVREVRGSSNNAYRRLIVALVAAFMCGLGFPNFTKLILSFSRAMSPLGDT
ncbi:hypothetical protein DPMN_110946 [Dreissena polymorpha]|uniref:Uncharacterized protein n=1 Tax=Dreissena polymorpha TaxID=45954 RepID=A0A9D4QNI0_DREPO|nr:hypothetical protein DPMN_110946 [Dreissena polymorpha]